MWWVQTLWDARKGPGQTLLISHSQLRLQICRFLQVTWLFSGLLGCLRCGGHRTYRWLVLVSESEWYSWYLRSFSHTGKHWNGHTSSLHSLNTCKGFDWHWFYSSSSGAERHILVLTERNLNLKQVLQQFSFPNSAVQRNTDVQDGRKCVGLPLPCYWMVVSTDMLFLQDPLGSCKGNDSVIWGSSSFLEPCDSPYGHQRILVIISGQQFPFDHV